VVRLDFQLYRFAEVTEGYIVAVPAYENGSLHIRSVKAEMQKVLRSKVSEFTSDLANEILKAQGN
jgi:hypothetical protein